MSLKFQLRPIGRNHSLSWFSKTQSCKDKETHHWLRWCAQFKWTYGRPGRTRRCRVAVRSDSCARSSPGLLIGCVLFTQLQKGNSDAQKEYVRKNMVYGVCWVQIDMYLLTYVYLIYVFAFSADSWESRSGKWSSRIRHKNFWEKWVERMRNQCFDNLCQMFSQRPASDLKYYADVGFGLQ